MERGEKIEKYSKTRADKLMKAVYLSGKAVADAEGLVKRSVSVDWHYPKCLNKKIRKLKKPSDDDNTILKYIGGSDHHDATQLVAQRRNYIDEWTQTETAITYESLLDLERKNWRVVLALCMLCEYSLSPLF